MSEFSIHLAQNLIALRTLRGMSQADLGRAAQVPRSTLAHVESGRGNPTLDVLVRLSRSLGVGLEELVSPPVPGEILIKSNQLNPIEKAGGQARVLALLPEATRGVQMERLELKPLGHLGGVPHLPHTREFFHGFVGVFHIHVAGKCFCVEPGDLLVFDGNQKHSYQNRGQEMALGLSVVVQDPLSLQNG